MNSAIQIRSVMLLPDLAFPYWGPSSDNFTLPTLAWDWRTFRIGYKSQQNRLKLNLVKTLSPRSGCLEQIQDVPEDSHGGCCQKAFAMSRDIAPIS